MNFVEFVKERMEPLGEITTRAMFGGHTVYCDGVVFALIAGGALYLKADEKNRPEFEARGLEAFRPFEGPGVMQYYQAPPEMFEDEEALRHWAGAAVEAGRRAQAKKKPRKRGAGSK
jgi:DNA transformation protein